jgi:hypothetical protein
MNDDARVASELQAAVFLIETEPHVSRAADPERETVTRRP